LQVPLDDAFKADEMFRTLMGEKVEPRRRFIQKHALEVKDIGYHTWAQDLICSTSAGGRGAAPLPLPGGAALEESQLAQRQPPRKSHSSRARRSLKGRRGAG